MTEEKTSTQNRLSNPSVPYRLLELVEDHLELALLESRYESGAGLRRLMAMAGVLMCGWTAILCIQMAAIWFLMRLGLPWGGVCVGFAILWGAGGTAIYRRWARRDAGAGEPFAGSREELHRSFEWIRQHFL